MVLEKHYISACDVPFTMAAFVSILHSCDFIPFPSTLPSNMCLKTELWNLFPTIRLLMVSTEVPSLHLILSEQRTPNVMQHLLCTQRTQTGFSLNWWADRRNQTATALYWGNQISCSPSFLSSLWVIPSFGRLLSCLSPRLHLSQRPEWPQVSFLPFCPRLCLPVFVALCLSRFYSPKGENSQAVFKDLVKIWRHLVLLARLKQKWLVLINFMNKTIQNTDTIQNIQCTISLKIPGGMFITTSINTMETHWVLTELPVTHKNTKSSAVWASLLSVVLTTSVSVSLS